MTAFGVLVLLVAVGVAARRWLWPLTPPGRWRAEYGDDGFATAGEISRHLSVSGPDAITLGKTAVGPRVSRTVRVGGEETIGTLGGPRRGKSVAVSARIRAHRGPAFVSSTRLDLLKNTMGVRQQHGPVQLFLPESTGGMESTVFFPIQAGCADEKFASETAAAMIGATDSGSADDQTWLQSATSVLRGFLMAADLDGGDMLDVFRWVTNWRDPEPINILIHNGHEVVAAEVFAEVASPSEKGAASVMRAVKLATAFMSDPNVARIVCPGPEDAVLDVRKLIEQRGTLYAVTTQRPFSPLEPLSAVLAARLFDVARAVAAERGEALDPTFLLALDEIKVTARVPIHDWSAVAAGDGILLDWSAQSPAQLREKWGEHATDSILDCATTLLVFGGLKGSDLQRFADLCGERREDIEGDEDGRQEWRPVLTGARLARLRKFRAVVFSGECRPTIVKTPRWSVTVPIVWEKVRPPRREGVVVQRQVETRQRQAIPMPGPAQPHVLPPVTVHAEREESAA